MSRRTARPPNRNVIQKYQTQDRLRKKLAVNQGAKKICLTMIVKNEAKNMPRLLPSIKSVIDMISIVDTGSTDNTADVILKWGKENGIPTTVHHEPFKNFAYNRTHSITAAKKTYPNADYFLLSDADFVWEINKGVTFDKVLLIDHKYLIEQYNNSLSYWNIRLLSAKVDWVCEGVTHEYWIESTNQTDYAGEVRTAKIHTLAIDDREDGGCKEDKFTRDEKLLKEGLDDPETPPKLRTRYKFYLAQTLKDMQKFDESIIWYEKRIIDKGWDEEIYYAKFQLGFNYESLGWKKKAVVSILTKYETEITDNLDDSDEKSEKSEKSEEDIKFIAQWNPNNLEPTKVMQDAMECFNKAVIHYKDAHFYRKVRAESIYYLTRMYRLLGQHELCYKTALLGQQIKFPDHDTLFVERGCYQYLFDFEISIVAYYIPNLKDIGRQACSRLLSRSDLPEWILKIAEQNSRHYI